MKRRKGQQKMRPNASSSSAVHSAQGLYARSRGFNSSRGGSKELLAHNYLKMTKLHTGIVRITVDSAMDF